MQLKPISINCQIPIDGRNIDKTFNLIECSVRKNSDEYNVYIEKANKLAELVNAAAANNSELNRLPKRKTSDAIMGILAEEGWLQYINSNFPNLASYTPFEDVTAQIDLKLTNNEKIEIRSSFVRNGLKFAICHDRYNFKNIGPYSNTVKPGEIQKELYLAVLFDIEKEELLEKEIINFYLIGGSTWEMMVQIGYDDPLTPVDALVPIKSKYKVIQFKDALDVEQIISAIVELGYNRI